jgi:hypothetical protein
MTPSSVVHVPILGSAFAGFHLLSSRLVPPHLQVLVHLLPSVIFSVPCSSLGALDFHHHSFLMFHVGPILIIVYRVRECMYKHITVIKSPIVNRT